MDRNKLAIDAANRLKESLNSGKPDSVSAALVVVADYLVSGVKFGWRDFLRDLSGLVSKLHARKMSDDEQTLAAAEIRGQLRAIVIILATAHDRQSKPEVSEVLQQKGHRRLLEVLMKKRGPFSNRELADCAELSEAHVARLLPTLRAAGLVTSTRAWKRMSNELNPNMPQKTKELLESSVSGGQGGHGDSRQNRVLGSNEGDNNESKVKSILPKITLSNTPPKVDPTQDHEPNSSLAA